MNKYKKIVLVIVEGPSDDEALAYPLTKVFSNSTVHVEILHYDITTKKGHSRGNIITKVNRVIKGFLDNNSYTKNDIHKIIHIVDTDGAFIPRTSIVHDSSLDYFTYSTDEIRYNNVNKVISRNEQKKGCLRRLFQTNKIAGISYNIYFMSCNLDHVLHNALNLSDKEKEDFSFDFAIKCKKSIIDFVSFISNPLISVSGDYLETWDFIQQENNSLHRHTNLKLSFPTSS